MPSMPAGYIISNNGTLGSLKSGLTVHYRVSSRCATPENLPALQIGLARLDPTAVR